MLEAVAIVGPTAVGKSRLGLTLAERFAGEIVSADALQVYRGFDIGTAKPSADELERVRHHLIDILDPDEPFSAGEFARRGRRAIREIRDRRRVPFVLGGSGLYLRALLEGLSPIPASDPEVRETLRSRLRSEGLTALREDLERLDPATADRLQPTDSQRTLRALEVLMSTGKPLSVWLAQRPIGRSRIAAVKAGLTLPRAVLYDRISERVRQMIQQGWVEEVEDLLRRGLSPELPAFQAIGYRDLAAHVLGECSLEEAVATTIRDTRRYAKRQMTWFRRETEVTWFSADDPLDCLRDVTSFLESEGIGGNNAQS